jgi:hypothetical protein
VNQVRRERAEIRWVTSGSSYELSHHPAPHLIEITNDYVAPTNGERTVVFDCVHCGLWYVVSKKDIDFLSLGVLEPDLVSPETEF